MGIGRCGTEVPVYPCFGTMIDQLEFSFSFLYTANRFSYWFGCEAKSHFASILVNKPPATSGLEAGNSCS
ncbi:MAG: hypothetical protein GTO17_11865 [Candidatus Aminicenantes bacterium]|nr:hypothetical protein [Candidatus Aminicenantes bacterium]